MLCSGQADAAESGDAETIFQKEVVYSVPPDAGSPGLENLITHAIRDTFLSKSIFGPYQQKGFIKRGLLGMGEPMLVSQGIVMQIPYPPSFQIKYQITQSQQSTHFSMTSYTACNVRVAPVAGNPGHYQISVGPLEEKIYDTALWHLDALASKDKIAADVVQVMNAVPLTFTMSLAVTDSFEVPLPAKPIARKYLDAIGSAVITTHKDETGLRPEENDHVTLSFVRLLPVRGDVSGVLDFLPTQNGTRISARYNVPYVITPDGNSTYSPVDVSNLINQVRAIASAGTR